MTPVSVVALFCEDIREEKNSSNTLIGVMPDRMTAQPSDGSPSEGTPIMPKLCIYTRLHFDPRDDIGTVGSKLVFPNGEERTLDLFDADSVSKAKEGALKRNSHLAGVFARLTIPNFPILAEGRVELVVTIRGTAYIAGSLEIKINRTSSTETEPPS